MRKPTTAGQQALIWLRARPWRFTLLAGGLFVLWAVVVTAPFAWQPQQTMVAPVQGDIAGSIGLYEALRQANANPFIAQHASHIAYPDGPPNNTGVNRVSFLSVGYLWGASHLIGTIPAHSLMSLLGYVLTALVTYLFVRRVTGSAAAGLIAGAAYGFWPTMYGLARSDMTYTHMWLFILPLWAFWLLLSRPWQWRQAGVAAVSIVPAVFWTPYYMLHVTVIGLACLAVAVWYLGRHVSWRTSLLFSTSTLLTWAGVLAFYRWLGLSAAGGSVPIRELSDFYVQSAHPLMFLLPGGDSWGPNGNALLAQLVPRAAHINLYIGLSVLALGALAVAWMMWHMWRPNVQRPPASQQVAVTLALAAAASCVWFSLPPTFSFHNHLHMMGPSWLITLVAPALRAGQRFVMPLMASLALLAGIGVAVLLKRLSERTRWLTTVALLLVVSCDLWALPANSTTVVARLTSLAALRALPQAPVVQVDHGSLVNQRLPCIYLNQYSQPLINDCGLGRSATLISVLDMPNLCDQLIALRRAGTRYVISSPTDKTVLDCLARSSLAGRIAGQDELYRVTILR